MASKLRQTGVSLSGTDAQDLSVGQTGISLKLVRLARPSGTDGHVFNVRQKGVSERVGETDVPKHDRGSL